MRSWGLCNSRVSIRPSVCLVDRQQQWRAAGFLLRSRYRLIGLAGRAFQFAIRIDSIRYANLFESIRFVKKLGLSIFCPNWNALLAGTRRTRSAANVGSVMLITKAR